MSAKVKRKQRRQVEQQSAVKKVAGLEAALADAHARRLNAEREKEAALAEERKTTLELLNERTMLRSELERFENEQRPLENKLLVATAELETVREELSRAKQTAAEFEKRVAALESEDRDAAKLRRRVRDAKAEADEFRRQLNRAEQAIAEFKRSMIVREVRRGAA
jgi:predicted RNase H-like nuclease (RuvC/YqgF family)